MRTKSSEKKERDNPSSHCEQKIFNMLDISDVSLNISVNCNCKSCNSTSIKIVTVSNHNKHTAGFRKYILYYRHIFYQHQ